MAVKPGLSAQRQTFHWYLQDLILAQNALSCLDRIRNLYVNLWRIKYNEIIPTSGEIIFLVSWAYFKEEWTGLGDAYLPRQSCRNMEGLLKKCGNMEGLPSVR